MSEMVKVVRCHDCAYSIRRLDGSWQCAITRHVHQPNWYCADGEIRETCHNVSDVDGIFVCSKCKCQIEGMVVLNGARRWVVPPYCPNCGRQVSE